MNINGLIKLQKWVNIFANYILWLMMVYLTDVWELEFVHAAAIINIWMGSTKVLPVVFAHLADAFIGNSIAIIFSSLSSMIGYGLIWMSTPPVLGKSNGNCTQYSPECIGEQQKQLLYVGLAFTAMGMAAHSACYAPFAHEHAGEGGAEDGCDCYIACCCVGCRTHLITLAALLVATFVKPWATLFGVCAILGAISFLVCLIHMVAASRNNNPISRPQGSPLTTMSRVLLAASTKSFYPQPHDASELYENPNTHQQLLPHTKSLRCLDKAAIIKAEPALQEQEKNRWNLCKVTEVEETKLAIRTIPIWMTFIVCGVISSLNATYFLEQAKSLDPRVGKAKAPLILFLWLYDYFKRSFTPNFYIIKAIVIGDSTGRFYIPRIGIIAAMVYATLSCITAAKVEARRLGVIQGKGLIDEKTVPMTIFWILPQFVLLGGLDGLQSLSAYNFSVDRAPASMIKYFHLFARGFFGLGVMASVVSVYVVGLVSEATTGTTWFQSTLNSSRLDNYYWVLATLAALNLVFFVVVACFYRYEDSRYERHVQRLDDYL